jgi:hypothetical protein
VRKVGDSASLLVALSITSTSTGDLNLKNLKANLDRSLGTNHHLYRSSLIEAMANNDKVREMRAGDTTKCANDVCAKPGEHMCSRCRGVKYCSASCQKVHWKQGGHKQACSADPADGVRGVIGGGGGCKRESWI